MHEEELNYHFKGVPLSLSAYLPTAATSHLQHIDDGVVKGPLDFLSTFEICIALFSGQRKPSVLTSVRLIVIPGGRLLALSSATLLISSHHILGTMSLVS